MSPPRGDPMDDTRTGDTFADLLPEIRTVTLGKRDVQVRALTLEEMPPVVAPFAPLIKAYGNGGSDGLAAISRELNAPACAVAEACTGIPASVWRAADAAKLLAVVKVALEMHVDFFVHGLELAGMLGAMVRPADGLTQSPTSQAAGTPDR